MTERRVEERKVTSTGELIASLVDGGLNLMMWAKVRIVVAVMVAVSAGAGAAASQEPSKRPADEFARIDKQIKDAQVKPEDRKMDQIGWAKTIREGMELAKKHGRLFFFFGFDGESIETGRC